MFNLYWTLGIGAISLIIGLGTGYKFEASRFDSYKLKVQVAAKVQQAETKQKEAESITTTREINDAYQDNIRHIRMYYANKLRHTTGGSGMSQISNTTIGADEASSNPVLAGQCAETTDQLNQLQDWIKKQQDIFK